MADTQPDAASADSAPIRGALVVLEGLDRSGKTTQVQILAKKLVEQGRRVEVLRFPGVCFFSFIFLFFLFFFFLFLARPLVVSFLSSGLIC